MKVARFERFLDLPLLRPPNGHGLRVPISSEGGVETGGLPEEADEEGEDGEKGKLEMRSLIWQRRGKKVKVSQARPA